MRKNAYEDEIEQLRAFIEDGGAPPAGLEGISEGEARQRAMRLFEELPPPALDSEPGPPMSRQDRAEDWWKHRAMVLDEIEKMTAFVEGRGPLPMNWQNTENLLRGRVPKGRR